MNEVFEAIMLVCFGLSWPMNAIKHWKAGTAKAMSLEFIILILSGYIAGVISKIITPPKHTYVTIIYCINLINVSIDLAIYFRNRKKDLAIK